MKVVELIPFINEIETDAKIHFAKGGTNPEDALIAFTNGSFKEWQEYQRNENFKRQYVLSPPNTTRSGFSFCIIVISS